MLISRHPRLIPLAPVLLLALSLGACDQVPLGKQNAGFVAPAESADTTPVVARVNGQPITQAQYDFYARARSASQPEGDPAADRQQILDDLIKTELVYQDALKRGVDKHSDVAAQIAFQNRSLLVGANIKDVMAGMTVSDADMQALYDEQIAKVPDTEFKARHILVESEADARALIAELDKGADFATLAKEKSTGPSGAQGGDLGWFAPNRMVAPFSEAVQQLEKGSYSKDPVQTQFGWHVILLEDTRSTTPPTLEQVRPQLQKALQGKMISDYIAGLQTAAKVEVIALDDASTDTDATQAGGADSAGE